jgi:elongation factor P
MGRIIAVTPPLFVELLITECEPGVQGDSSKSGTKPAIVETGLHIRVPLFVNNGEKVRIDTRTGDYVERVS